MSKTLQEMVEKHEVTLDMHHSLLEGEGNGSLADLRSWYMRDWAATRTLLEALRPRFAQMWTLLGVVAVASVLNAIGFLALLAWVLLKAAPAIAKLAAITSLVAR